MSGRIYPEIQGVNMKTTEEACVLEFDDANTSVIMSGVPIIMMSRQAFGALHKGMVTTLGRGAKALLYTSGYNAGKVSLAAVVSAWDCKSTEEIIEATRKQYAHYGWFNLREVSREGDVLNVKVTNSFEIPCYAGKATEPVCHFLEGFLCSYLEAVYSMENLVGEEVRCQAMGDEICEFVLRPKFW